MQNIGGMTFIVAMLLNQMSCISYYERGDVRHMTYIEEMNEDRMVS